MSQPRVFQQSFVGGEMSTKMFGRPDDKRYQHGAARLQNLLPIPQGPAQKRPGTAFVREVKNSDNRARLIPFNFSQDQTLVLEMGRDTVESREIGYFRFHTNGGTVLYTLPRTFVAPEVIDFITGDTFTTLTTHTFLTGDPVVLTIRTVAEQVVTFTTGTPGLVNLTSHGFVANQQVIFQFFTGDVLPEEIEENRLYYVGANPATNSFSISQTPGGNLLAFSTAGSGTRWVGAMPVGGGTAGPLHARRTYFAINLTTTTLQLAETKADALALNQITITNVGTSISDHLHLHFDYQIGDLVTNAALSYYCFRNPTGDPASVFLGPGDHTGHNPLATTTHWVELPGTHSTVTTTFGTDRVNWTTHGQSEGTTVIFSTSASDPPDGIVVDTTYYIRNPNAGDFQISLTPGGAIVDILDDGTGTHTALAGSVFEAPHFFELDEILEVGYAQSNDIVTIVHENRPPIDLSRFDATRWTSADVVLNDSVPPADVAVVADLGDGWELATITAATPAVITTTNNHTLANGDTIYLQDATDDNSVPDGFYAVQAAATNTFQVINVDDHGDQTSATTTLGTDPMMWPATVIPDVNEIYVVTAIGGEEESPPSEEFSVFSLLHNANSFNTVTWSAAPGAERYRVYKKQTGIFGFIGEVASDQPLELKDDNIGPDLSITPPILDIGLRKQASVTFDSTEDLVIWVGHTLVDGSPVVFQSSGDLPTLLIPYTTYYVLDPSDEDNFQVAAAPGGPALSLSGGDTDEFHQATAGQFPSAVTYFEQRRVFAGSLTNRQRVRMTASGTQSDMSFSIPTVASDRILFDVASLEAGAVRHAVPLSHLMVLSASTEFRVTPINDDAITPTSISIRPQSFVGSNKAQPIIVNNVGIFAANRGGHVREMGFSENVISYIAGDLSLRATHLFDGLTVDELAYSKAPIPVVWGISSGGDLLSLTYIPEESIGAWAHHVTDGTFESCVSIAEGTEDHLYVIVKRNIDGNDVRYVERMADLEVDALADAFFVDAGFTYSGPAATVINGLDHLEGETVVALANGLVVTGLTVASGSITLPTAATPVHVGLATTTELQPLPITMAIPAFGHDRRKNINAVWIRVDESGAFLIGPDAAHLVPSQLPAPGALLSGSVDVVIPATWTADGQIVLRQTAPLPLTVVSVSYEVAPGG